MKSLFLHIYRENAIKNILNRCGIMDESEIVQNWIINKMQNGKWESVNKESIDVLKSLFEKLNDKGI